MINLMSLFMKYHYMKDRVIHHLPMNASISVNFCWMIVPLLTFNENFMIRPRSYVGKQRNKVIENHQKSKTCCYFRDIFFSLVS